MFKILLITPFCSSVLSNIELDSHASLHHTQEQVTKNQIQ
jgi:hypothetical protein